MRDNKFWLLKPAYGRTYLTARAAMRDWENGKDFYIVNGDYAGSYCSIRDIKLMKSPVNLRWNNYYPVFEIGVDSLPD